MSKILVLGDTHEGISAEQQLSNLEEILTYKGSNPDKVILLRGNHDTQHLGYYWAECSGWNQVVGHTPVQKGIYHTHNTIGQSEIWFCDALGVKQYLVIDNNEFQPKTFEQ